MTTLPKIFKRTTTGKIQEWWMEIDGPKYRTISGQQDGKKVISEWTYCKGKNLGKVNETSPNEQALKEANAKRDKKLEADYKEKVTEVDDVGFQSPMLAEPYVKKKKGKPDEVIELTYPVFVQPKLDGMRCIVNNDGMWSRKGNPVLSSPHIREILDPIFRDDSTIELDGELYNHDLKDNFDELISIVRQVKPDAEELKKSRELCQFHVYDFRDPEKIFSARTKYLKRIISKLNDPSIVFVETHEASDKFELDELYNTFLKSGYEGQMIRADTPYEFDRTKCLIKRKETMTEEFEIVDILEGKGNRSGMAGNVVIKLDSPSPTGETTCEAGIKGGVNFYRKLLEEKADVIGKLGTIEFQNYTPKGSLRFPKLIAIRDYE